MFILQKKNVTVWLGLYALITVKLSFYYLSTNMNLKNLKCIASTNKFGSFNDITMCPQLEIDHMKFVPC